MSELLTRLGVHRLPIPIPFPEAGGPANVYLIEEDGGGLALFDAGIGTAEGERALLEGFARLGRSLREVRRIFISHGHLDHYGYARAAQEQSGAPVFAHERDHDKISWRDRDPARLERHAQYLARLGAGPELAALSRAFQAQIDRMARPIEDVQPLPDGTRLRFARFSAEVLHLPGHTPGLVCLWAEEQRVLFSDDHLLELISPNPLLDLEGRPTPRHRALVEYLRSALRVRALPAELIAPGHGPTFAGHVAVIDRLLRFYELRQEKIHALLLAHGALTPAQLAPLVFPNARPHQQYLILSEVAGNLEVLEDRGRVARADRDGRTYFEAVV
jgi:glyoxylase-like metal-dependent hydrolase (beta-lactamase superfamily II)